MTKAVLERGLDVEITDHLGYKHGDPAGYGSGNSRNRHGRKTVLTIAGSVELEVPTSANTVTSVKWWAVLNALITDAWCGLGLVALEGDNRQREPTASVNSPRAISASKRRSSENPDSHPTCSSQPYEISRPTIGDKSQELVKASSRESNKLVKKPPETRPASIEPNKAAKLLTPSSEMSM